MWINDEASSSTLVEGLAPHDHKRHVKINWIHDKQRLTIRKHSQRPRHNKSRVSALYDAFQHVCREKYGIYKLILGFQCCRVGRVRSSAPSNAIECTHSGASRDRFRSQSPSPLHFPSTPWPFIFPICTHTPTLAPAHTFTQPPITPSLYPPPHTTTPSEHHPFYSAVPDKSQILHL